MSLLAPTRGELLIDDIPLDSMNKKAWQRQFRAYLKIFSCLMEQ